MRRFAALALAGLVALAGCTSGDGAGGRPATPGARVGGVVRVGLGELGAVDPQDVYEPNGWLAASLVCEPLLVVDPASGELRPGLAASWAVTNDGRRISLRLRKGLRYSDGSRVTADDVAASLTRAASESFAGHAAPLLEPVDGWDELSGRAEPQRARDARVLRGVNVVDGGSLLVDLKRRDADFLRVLASPVASPVPRRHAGRAGTDPVCAGPYRLERPWSPGQAVVRLVRNRHYHGRSEAFSRGGRGYADVVELHVVADPLAAWRSGQVDVAAVPGSRRPVGEPDLVSSPSGFIDYVGLPLGEASPFARPEVRVALSRALDRALVVAEAFGGGRDPAGGFLPGVLGGEGCGDAAPAGGDVAAARAALARAGVDLRGVPLKLYFNDELGNRGAVESVARQWREAFALDVQVVPTPFDDLLRRASGPGGLDGAFRIGWQPAVPRADAYFAPLFTAQGIGRDNQARFVDPRFERELDRTARGAVDDDERAVAYRRLEGHLCRAMPLVPVTAARSHVLLRSARVGVAGPAALDVERGRPVVRELWAR